MAAEAIADAGWPVRVFDSMPSVGRKFLLAGKGGLNLTHSEPKPAFLERYGPHLAHLAPLLAHFDAEAACRWAHSLGIQTFVGSSGRVFPEGMKAAPLLRAWLARLRAKGVGFHMRHCWLGWQDEEGSVARFSTPAGEVAQPFSALVLALGGASWPQLGSDGRWVPIFTDLGMKVAPLKPANCGFERVWSPVFSERFAGCAVKNVVARLGEVVRSGEMMVTNWGMEGGLIYALSGPLRDAIDAGLPACLSLDLAPGRELAKLTAALSAPRGRDSWSNHLRRKAGIEGVKAGLLRECVGAEDWESPVRLAQAIKALPLTLSRPRPIAEAISSAGGLCFDELDANLMLKRYPGIFCAGEMLDWEAPTGGYLLTAVLATGLCAGRGVANWLQQGVGADMMRGECAITKGIDGQWP